MVAGRDLSPKECASEHPGEAAPSGRVPGPLLRVQRLLLDSQGQVGLGELLGRGNWGELLGRGNWGELLGRGNWGELLGQGNWGELLGRAG